MGPRCLAFQSDPATDLFVFLRTTRAWTQARCAPASLHQCGRAVTKLNFHARVSSAQMYRVRSDVCSTARAVRVIFVSKCVSVVISRILYFLSENYI